MVLIPIWAIHWRAQLDNPCGSPLNQNFLWFCENSLKESILKYWIETDVVCFIFLKRNTTGKSSSNYFQSMSTHGEISSSKNSLIHMFNIKHMISRILKIRLLLEFIVAQALLNYQQIISNISVGSLYAHFSNSIQCQQIYMVWLDM